MFTSIAKTFQQYGWLMPVLFPAAQITGRAVFNVFAVLYCIWGTLYLLKRRPVLPPKPVVIAYGLLIASFLLSLTQAYDVSRGFNMWVNFFMHSMTLFFTYAVLKEHRKNLTKVMMALGIGGILALSAALIEFPFYFFSENFDPRHQLHEDTLPFLLPFMLYFFYTKFSGKYRPLIVMIPLTLSLSYIITSGGRAALLATIVSAILYLAFSARWHLTKIIPLFFGLVFIAFLTGGQDFLRGTQLENQSLTQTLDRFTSYRTVIWRKAIEFPPKSIMMGVGMDNTRYAAPANHSNGLKVKHLHNVFMDAWYETGLIGLGALLTFLLVCLILIVRMIKDLSPLQRNEMGLLLAASLAILSASLLSFSYSSKEFSTYLFFLIAIMLSMRSSAHPTSSHASKNHSASSC